MFTQFNNTVARAVVGTAGTAVCAAICLFGATAPAHADEVTPTVSVSYADLDVSRVEGRATLASRIRQAARSVCLVGAASTQEVAKQNACIRQNVSVGMQTAVARTQVAAR